MTTPTNWPDPTRPGVPMFPEQDGWHWISNKEGGGLYPCKWVFVPENIYGGFWDCSGKRVFPYIIAGTDNYLAPCPHPTQIAEMLAAERERCAREAVRIGESWDGTELSPTNTAHNIAHAIRNLGAAP